LLKSGSWCLAQPPSKRFTLQEIQQNNLISKGTRVNKSELIDAIAASADIPKAVAGRALDAVIESVTGALKAGDSVVLVGFGTFAVKDRAARTGRNPQTGNPISIAAAKIPGFKAGKALKDAVN
jgi:DNA-binding protein HU-beta